MPAHPDKHVVLHPPIGTEEPSVIHSTITPALYDVSSMLFEHCLPNFMEWFANLEVHRHRATAALRGKGYAACL